MSQRHPPRRPQWIAADVARYLTDIAGSLRRLDKLAMSGDLSEPERAEWWAQMIAAVYARFTVVGTTFVEARLTAAAERHGLALALPEAVDAEWRARPGTDPRFSVRRERAVRIPIAGRDEWEQAARLSA